MIQRADEVMSNTRYSNDWMFYHDSLSLITSKECLQWMKATPLKGISIFKRWLLPVNPLKNLSNISISCVKVQGVGKI